MAGRIREANAKFGVFWVPPDRDTVGIAHTTRKCPDVGPAFECITVSDPAYAAYFNHGERCDWCRDYHRASRRDSSR